MLTCSVVDKATGTTLTTAQLKITVTATNYTIRYDANGGTNAPASQTKTAGQALTLTNDCPKREGYTFVGWATTSNGSAQYQPRDSYTADQNITLYAVWKLDNQASLSLTKDSFTVKPDELITVNYTFTGDVSKVDYTIQNTGICKYVSGDWKQNQHNGTLTFKALSSGTTDITIRLYNKENQVSDSKTVSVTVEQPQGSGTTADNQISLNLIKDSFIVKPDELVTVNYTFTGDIRPCLKNTVGLSKVTKS